ncbi:MAG: class I SAM-dependent methyltransferase [Oscillospiraceae bacterium]|nr:class I SAM-dependent methyltransferase [Oscillospiraceae bacterium]
MSGYVSFAQYYDVLMENASYGIRARFLDETIQKYNHGAREVLDLACGTGSMTHELIKLGYDMTGADASADMLSHAAQKCGGKALFLNQEMGGLDLYGTVDAVVCTLDSVNHLPDERAVIKAFHNASLFLNPGGLFIFDVNTAFKHREILDDNVFIYDTPKVFCCWQNTLCRYTLRVDIRLDFFAPLGDKKYTRESECFSEWYYSDLFLKDALIKTGLSHIETLCGDSFTKPCESTERLVYVARKERQSLWAG